MKICLKVFCILILIVSSNIYGFSIIERLNMPANKKYINYFNISFNLIKEKHIENVVKIEPKVNVAELLKLTAIFKIDKKFFAILNGDTYSKGAKIGNYKVLSIDLQKVVLQNLINKGKVVLKIEN